MVWMHNYMLQYGATPRHYIALVDQYARIIAAKRKEVRRRAMAHAPPLHSSPQRD